MHFAKEAGLAGLAGSAWPNFTSDSAPVKRRVYVYFLTGHYFVKRSHKSLYPEQFLQRLDKHYCWRQKL